MPVAIQTLPLQVATRGVPEDWAQARAQAQARAPCTPQRARTEGASEERRPAEGGGARKPTYWWPRSGRRSVAGVGWLAYTPCPRSPVPREPASAEPGVCMTDAPGVCWPTLRLAVRAADMGAGLAAGPAGKRWAR